MKIEKNENYIRISSFSSIEDLLSVKADISENLKASDVSAVSFVFPEDFSCEKAGEDFSEFILGLKALTVAQISDPEKCGLEMLLLFDRVVSDRKYIIKREMISSGISSRTSELYRLRMGKKDAWDLKCFAEDENSSELETRITVCAECEEGQEPSDAYLTGIFNEKSSYQNRVLASCFVNGRINGIQAVLDEESIGFFNLVQKKSEEMNIGNE